MALSWLHRLRRMSRPPPRSGRETIGRNRFVPNLEALADWLVPAVTASLQGSRLIVSGDEFDNTITVGRDAAGQIVDAHPATTPSSGGTATTC